MGFLNWRRTVAIVALLSMVACGQAAPTATSGGGDATLHEPGGVQPAVQSHGGAVKDHVSFVDHLRDQGLTVEIVSDVQQPFLRGKGTLLRVSGGGIKQAAEIQSYNYDDTDLGTDGVKAAKEDADQIGPNGNPKTAMITWVAPPHFFRKERLIAIYVGDDPAVLKLLSEVLGPQFAGQ
ncbi:MAG TPA: hypothetical protein VLA19_05255 [Herpetosiphonaceae bacterium]|nr:hypothetical protein [Herpetosiphonaceae bacterium]